MEFSTHILILLYVLIFILIWIAGELHAIKKTMSNIFDITEKEKDIRNDNLEHHLTEIKNSLSEKK